MKKLLLTGCLSLIMLSMSVPVVASASTAAETECDEVFAATISAVADGAESEVQAVRKPLYDINVNPLGYVYEYTLEGSDGYAVFIYGEDGFAPQEVMPDNSSPYAESKGKCVYVCSYTYLEYADGEYVDLDNGLTLSDEAVELMSENAVYGQSGIMPLAGTQVTIVFKSKDKHEYLMSIQPPRYDSSPYIGACACIAGANIIGYYDRYYENLIPDFVPGYLFYNMYYLYYNQAIAVDEVIKQLYSDMGTTSNGTTEAQFLNGMSKYCKRAGYNFGYTSMMSGGKLNYSNAIKYMEEYNQPIALFLSGYNVATVVEGDSQDGYGYNYSNANHIMVGFGYRYVTYTYSNGSTETFNFIYVSSGNGSYSAGYYNINYSSSTLDDALAINIY